MGGLQLLRVARPRRAAIVTRSGRESAFILRITWPLCAFTVISLMPSSPADLFVQQPRNDQAITSRSRGVSDS